jgi:hypothetical protein
MATLYGLLIAIPFFAGCAASGTPEPLWAPRASFGVAEDLPRVVAYGALGKFVPNFAPTPALDEFLYGPTESPGLLLRNPQGLTPLGTQLLVCDQGYPAIMGIDLASGRSAAWEDSSHGPRCPVAIAAGDERVYVADTTRRAVLVYQSDGKFVEMLTPGAEGDRGFRPCSLAIGRGVLYVGNLAGRRVDRWDLAGHAWLPPLAAPTGGLRPVAPTGLAITSDAVLLIADSVQGRVFRATVDGKWLDPIGRPGRLEGEFVRPKQVAVTPSGLIAVSDAGRQSLMLFAANGDYIAEIAGRDRNWPGFTLPMGVLALPANGLAPLLVEGRPAPEPRPDEWLIVSDTLSAASLNVFGIFLPHRGGGTRAAD